MKTCTRCGVEKPFSEFFKHTISPDGLRPTCKPCFKMACQAYHAATRPQRLAKMREYNQVHFAEHQVYKRQYAAEHPEVSLKACRQRRARIADAPINDFTRGAWTRLKAAFGHRCAYCGRHVMKLETDHVIPLFHGGSHTARNIVPACNPCNRKKGTGPAGPMQVIPIAFIE